jgi:hypothetical protein
MLSRSNKLPTMAQSLRQARTFAIVTPPTKLHFTDHPRYGKVYPVVTYDFSKHGTFMPITSYVGLTLVNLLCMYGTFVTPIFTAAAASLLSNPLFLGPSLLLNFALHQKYFILF